MKAVRKTQRHAFINGKLSYMEIHSSKVYTKTKSHTRMAGRPQICRPSGLQNKVILNTKIVNTMHIIVAYSTPISSQDY